MMRTALAAAGLLLLAAMACGAGASQSPPQPAAMATRSRGETILPTAGPAIPAAAPALEARTLTLEWPPTLRAGDSDVVRLTLEADESGAITPTAEIAGHQTSGKTVYIPDLYATHNVVAAARLDLAGAEVRPADVVGQPLRPGESVTFLWSVRPEEVGFYRGSLWLYLRFVPLDGSAVTELAISSQVIEIEAVSLFGIRAGPARLAGALGTLAGTVAGFPFLEQILRALWRRRPSAGAAKG